MIRIHLVHVSASILIIGSGLLALGGCGTTRHKEEGVVVARVDGRPITATQLQEEMHRQGLVPSSPLEDSLHKSLALDTLITNQLAKREAETLDLSRDHALQKEMRQTVLQIAVRTYADEVIVPRESPTPQDVERYRQEHPEQFTVRKTIVAPQQIVLMADLKDPGYKALPTEYAGWTAQAIIDDLYRRLQAREDFDTLAVYYSQDIFSRVQGGRLGWKYYDSAKVTPWLDSLFSFSVGKIMPPFASEKAFFIVRINGRHEVGEILAPDDSTRRQIAQYLGQQRIQAWSKRFVDSILAAGQLQIFDSALTIPKTELSPDLPLAVSNGNDTIFAGEFLAHSVGFAAADGTRNLQVEDKRRLLKEIHRLHTLWNAMKDLGYLDRPDITRAREDFLHDAAEARVRAQAVDRTYAPADEEIETFYREHPAEFGAECPVRVQHIMLDNPDTARAVKRLLDQGADFVELARRYYRGDPEMQNITYDLGFISPQDMPKEFFDAALALAPGEVSNPVQTQWGYHIIRVVEKHEATPLRVARDAIAARLGKRHDTEAFRKWRENLLLRHQIMIDQQVLVAVPILPIRQSDSTAVDTTGAPKP